MMTPHATHDDNYPLVEMKGKEKMLQGKTKTNTNTKTKARAKVTQSKNRQPFV
jgi:hypothetical protein